jgi:hypothetical protein
MLRATQPELRFHGGVPMTRFARKGWLAALLLACALPAAAHDRDRTSVFVGVDGWFFGVNNGYYGHRYYPRYHWDRGRHYGHYYPRYYRYDRYPRHRHWDRWDDRRWRDHRYRDDRRDRWRDHRWRDDRRDHRWRDDRRDHRWRDRRDDDRRRRHRDGD